MTRPEKMPARPALAAGAPGVEVIYMGQPLTDVLQSGWTPLTY